MRLRFNSMQRLGRALMLPIAVLPLAGLLLRLGQPDMLDLAFMAAAGNALFAHLGLLFAAGIAVGFAKENNGAAGLAGVVCFLVLTEGAKTLLAVPANVTATAAEAWRSATIAKLSVPAGIAAGVASGLIYNRFHDIRMPEYLAFFGGRRFVPIAAGAAGIAGALVLGFGLPAIEGGVDALSAWILRSGPVGLFIYGVANRLLLVTGLHHVLNNMAWFVVGDYHGATGDLKRFFAGDPTAGGFMSGFFPVMMFGLPAACLAMYRAAPPERRAQVGGLLFSLALTSALTGVTEPVEFTFLFLAPVLFAIHALLTGVAMVIMDALQVKLGFTFSAGLADYVINFGLAKKPLLLLPVGAAYFLVYYAVFSFAIRRLDLATPGREPADVAEDTPPFPADDTSRGAAFMIALGGPANLIDVDACTTRLRLNLADPGAIDPARLKQLGARGTLRPGGGSVQVVLGPIADVVAGEIRVAAAAPRPPARLPRSIETNPTFDRDRIIALFGGPDNVSDQRMRGNRLLISVKSSPPDLEERPIPGVRAILETSPRHYQVIIAPS